MRIHRTLSLCMAFVCLFTVGAFSRPAVADVVLASPDQPIAPVVHPARWARGDIAEVRLFAGYLREMTGQMPAIQPAGDNLPERAIVIEVGSDADRESLGASGFRIVTRGSRVHIIGGSQVGAFYGMFGLLEDVLGARYWTHDETYLPSRPTLVVPTIDRVIRPAFQQHDMLNREATNGAYRLRTSTHQGNPFTAGHNLCGMLRPHAEARPDLLPMDKDGNRKFNNLHMNYTAPGIGDLIASELAKEVEKRKGNVRDFIYFAGMGDWYGGMDLSPESKAIYEAETWTDPDGRKKPGYIAPLITAMNRAGELLEADHPGIRVGTFAYMSLEAPPANVVPRENVVIRVPRLRHATVRSVVESPKNRSFMRNLARWCELAPGRVYVWEYGASYKNFLVPFPCLYAMAENIKVYHEMGVAGVMIQGNYTSTGGDLAGVKNYVWRKLMWDPTLDPRELVREFCEGYYGPAASGVIEYIEALEASVRGEKPSDANEFSEPMKTFLSEEKLNAWEAILKPAIAATPDDGSPYRRRVMEVWASIEAARLWRPLPKTDPFVERDGRLIRRDFGTYTYDRAVALLPLLRGAGPNEWGIGPAHQQAFLATHGGPIYHLTAGAARAAVVPPLRGQVGPVQLGDTTVIAETRVHVDSGPARTHAPPENWTPGEPIVMRGDAGMSLWSRTPRQIETVSVNTVDDASLLMELRAEVVDRRPESRTISARAMTAFAPAFSVENATVEVWEPTESGGAWKPVDITPLVEAWGVAKQVKDVRRRAESTRVQVQGGRVRITWPKAGVVDDCQLVPLSESEESVGPGRFSFSYDNTSGAMISRYLGPSREVPVGRTLHLLTRRLTVTPPR